MAGIEILIRGTREFASVTVLKRFLAHLLGPFDIFNFEVRICKAKNHAILTTHKGHEGSEFVRHYSRHAVSPSLLFQGGRLEIKFGKEKPNEFLVRVLQREEKLRLLEEYEGMDRLETAKPHISRPPSQREFRISSLACGNWDFIALEPHFHPYYYEVSMDATATFGDRYLFLRYTIKAGNDSLEMITYPSPDETDSETLIYSLLFPYSAIASMALDCKHDRAIVCTMTEAPKMWINGSRGIGLRELPLEVSTSCQVFHLRLSNPSDISQLLRLEREGILPQCSVGRVPALELGESFLNQMAQLKVALDDPRHEFTFAVKFQIQKLAQNGYLSPRAVVALINFISIMQQKFGSSPTVSALRRLFQQLPYAGPSTKSAELDTRAVMDLFRQNIESVVDEEPNPSSDSLTNVFRIHRAEVTPTATYLAGPDPEAGNRVLRKYSTFSGYFLRVTFMDEDGETFYSDPQLKNAAIFNIRFAEVLINGIEIGGRRFEFLGFSHSSLRAQTCWFLAPFLHLNQQIDADTIITSLGDFSHIRSPARCAARIGQTFTETSVSVPVDPASVQVVKDVERNGRVFSDGVGTCSMSVLKTLQATQSPSAIPATVFQIRFAGAKGMVSLDTRLEGNILVLRPSMIKFRGSKDSSIEICGVASKMLPLVLNRQLIKILEDLNIPNNAFQQLQDAAIDELRNSVSSVENAAALLEKHDVGLATQTTWLVRKIHSLGFALSDDVFFRDLLDAVILIQLQELKYKTRLPTLAEGEVYCSWIDKEGHVNCASGIVVVARSPALHPGDIQTAKAITVPQDSPLNWLHNCIVFSSRGPRDLPSQLAGGDLDGDLYHVSWDKGLIPQSCQKPASYPRLPPLDIGRPVTRYDMGKFFVKFMEQDQLGRVATQHQVLADQHDSGTLHDDCMKLAELHSTAVDFSKTGIPVREKQLPINCRHNGRYRPDFMAPGRKVKIEKHGIIFQSLKPDDPEDDDPRRVGEPRRYRFYESKKILGILYRCIDERTFFRELHERSAVLKDDSRLTRGVLTEVWEYVQAETRGLNWEDYAEEAVAMREAYDAMVLDIILQYSTHPTERLEEIEVFIGSVICRTGYRSKRQKEYMTGMKEKYDREVLSLMATMRDEEARGFEHEALLRSMACLYVGIEEPAERKERVEGGRKDTFGWIAAAACLRELEEYQEKRDVGPLKTLLGKLKVAGGR
ncbi:MAG: hypothetical protein Q9185_001055 [Variospora sp. 1 TL-2023]